MEAQEQPTEQMELMGLMDLVLVEVVQAQIVVLVACVQEQVAMVLSSLECFLHNTQEP